MSRQSDNQGATPCGGRAATASQPSPQAVSGIAGIPSAAEFCTAIEGLLKLRSPDMLTHVERAHVINAAIDLLERMEAAGSADPAYVSFTDGMQAAAEICGTLAETTYDDSDGFAAATGCEAAIMRVVRQQRREQGQ